MSMRGNFPMAVKLAPSLRAEGEAISGPQDGQGEGGVEGDFLPAKRLWHAHISKESGGAGRMGVASCFEAGGLARPAEPISAVSSCFPHPIRRASPDTFPTSWGRWGATRSLAVTGLRWLASACVPENPMQGRARRASARSFAHRSFRTAGAACHRKQD
jgi:hypothetical protein